MTTEKETNKHQLELTFTETYRQHIDAHVAIREAACLRVMYPALFEDIRPGDRFAGRLSYRSVGIGLEDASGGPGYYCHEWRLRRDLEEADPSAEERRRIEDMIAFWKKEATIAGKLIASLPQDVLEATSNPIAEMGGRLAGATLDFEKLVRLGLPGLMAEVKRYRQQTEQNGGDVQLYDGMRAALDLLADVCRDYAARARREAGRSDVDPAWSAELQEIAAILDRIVTARPETLREAIQLVWLYALISGVVNYGRMDIYLGDLYVHDVDSGRITEEEALSYLQSLWKLIADREIYFNGRIVIGGRGRPNEVNADRFALAAMEATRTVIETEPQLSLRFYEGMNPALLQKAYDVIGEGRTYPMLYNDDVNVPAVQHAFRVPNEEAEQYYPYGCGEYALDHISFGSPNCGFNLLKALEVVLYDGRDALTGKPLRAPTGSFRDFASFDELLAAYKAQVEYHVDYLARRHALEYEAEKASASFLFTSMLFDHCIERGRSVVDRGTRYQGGIIETFGMVNAADSLAAIKKLVYDEQALTPDELLAALDADFVGHERVHRLLLDVPKYGNDDPEADRMVQAVSDHVATYTRDQAERIGLDYFLVVNINNYANVTLGELTAASADGRRSGAPLANGNTPTAGNDRKGFTAFLNSIAKVDPSLHAGYVHNMKFTPQWFREDRPKLEALLRTYFHRGGTQAMITVVSRGDLEAAMERPEQYRHLIVRVGGFSARFVELSPEIQQDLVNRTLY